MQISEALHTKCDGEFLGRKESTYQTSILDVTGVWSCGFAQWAGLIQRRCPRQLWSVFLSTSSPILMMYLVCSVHSKGKGRPRGLPPINGGVASTTTGNNASQSTLFNKPVQLWLSFTNCQKKEPPSRPPPFDATTTDE